MTLPLIYTLNKVDSRSKNKIINTVKNHHKDDKKIAEIIKLVIENGGLEYAEKVMINYQKEALDILSEFPKNKYRDALQNLVVYVINRKR